MNTGKLRRKMGSFFTNGGFALSQSAILMGSGLTMHACTWEPWPWLTGDLS